MNNPVDGNRLPLLQAFNEVCRTGNDIVLSTFFLMR